MAYNKIIYKGDTLIDLTADTVTPETLAEGVTAHTRNGEIIVGSMTGGSGGNFKKKFMSLMRAKRTGSYAYDFVASFTSCMENQGGGEAFDAEILPTKTSDGIKVTNMSAQQMYIYFIEDENDVFFYGDITGSESNEWRSLTELLGAEFGGVVTNPKQVTLENTVYVLFYYVEAESE